MKKKLKPTQPNLDGIHKLYLIFRTYINRHMTYPDMTLMLYKSDKTKFQEAFKIIYGVECDSIGDEFVARLLMQSGLMVTKLIEYSAIVGSKDGNK